MKTIHRNIVLTLIAILGNASSVFAQALPEPLTYEFALSLVDEAHPDILLSQAQLQKAQSELSAANSLNDFSVTFEARAQWLSPPAPLEYMGNEDHRVILSANKNLYDFGRTSNQVDAAMASVAAREFYLKQQQLQRRYDIMAAYFDVVLSDIKFARDNEEMAIGYTRYDRIKQRRELGQYSDIEVLEAEADYQRIRRQRYESESRQRKTRTRLSLVLNRPSEIPSRVVPPAIDLRKTNLPEVEQLQQWVEQHNLELLALREELKSVQEKLASASANYLPSLDAQVLLGKYSREIGTNDTWRAGVTLDVPLYQGGRISAQKAGLIADRQQLDSRLLMRTRDLKQQALEGWMQFNDLKVRTEEMDVVKDYRELYLDRARAIYEMEVKTDLGDAMVELTQASLDWAKANYQQALVLEKLNILTAGQLKEFLQ